jgi:hypothetical protein
VEGGVTAHWRPGSSHLNITHRLALRVCGGAECRFLRSGWGAKERVEEGGAPRRTSYSPEERHAVERPACLPDRLGGGWRGDLLCGGPWAGRGGGGRPRAASQPAADAGSARFALGGFLRQHCWTWADEEQRVANRLHPSTLMSPFMSWRFTHRSYVGTTANPGASRDGLPGAHLDTNCTGGGRYHLTSSCPCHPCCRPPSRHHPGPPHPSAGGHPPPSGRAGEDKQASVFSRATRVILANCGY